MTFTSEEMIEAMTKSRRNHRFIKTEGDKESFRAGFYACAVWAASKMEETRQCKMDSFGNRQEFSCNVQRVPNGRDCVYTVGESVSAVFVPEVLPIKEQGLPDCNQSCERRSGFYCFRPATGSPK